VKSLPTTPFLKFELLTGRTPFAAADLMSVLMAVANDPPPAPHTFNRTIPRGGNYSMTDISRGARSQDEP
jgi:hypothetical protein